MSPKPAVRSVVGLFRLGARLVKLGRWLMVKACRIQGLSEAHTAWVLLSTFAIASAPFLALLERDDPVTVKHPNGVEETSFGRIKGPVFPGSGGKMVH